MNNIDYLTEREHIQGVYQHNRTEYATTIGLISGEKGIALAVTNPIEFRRLSHVAEDLAHAVLRSCDEVEDLSWSVAQNHITARLIPEDAQTMREAFANLEDQDGE